MTPTSDPTLRLSGADIVVSNTPGGFGTKFTVTILEVRYLSPPGSVASICAAAARTVAHQGTADARAHRNALAAHLQHNRGRHRLVQDRVGDDCVVDNSEQVPRVTRQRVRVLLAHVGIQGRQQGEEGTRRQALLHSIPTAAASGLEHKCTQLT
jgi:hypothetical protein